MINNVVLVGRLTRDPDLRYTQSGKAVVSFNLAVDSTFTDAQGNKKANFIQCVAWNKAAENLASYQRKGSRIAVTGSIQTRSYDDNTGRKVYVTEVLCQTIMYLEHKNEQEASQQQQQSSNFERSVDPFASNTPIDISDDDLPF